MSSDRKQIGARIAAARTERGWNQSELARRAGVSISYINRLEAGQVSTPSLARVSQIAAALGRSVAELTEPPPAAPPDLIEEITRLTGANDGLLRAVLAEVAAYPADQRPAALRFALESLKLVRQAPTQIR